MDKLNPAIRAKARMPAHACLLTATLLSACSNNLVVPDEAEIVCDDDGQCPSGDRCNPSTGLCVPADRSDLQAPLIVSATLSSDLLGRQGAGYATATLTLVVSERLAGSNSVFFVDGELSRKLEVLELVAQLSEHEFEYRAAYQPTGEESQAVFALNAVLEDAIGNRFEGALPLSLGFDFEAPQLLIEPAPTVVLLPDPVLNPLAREVAQITRVANRTTRVLLTFTVSEDVAAPVIVTEQATDLAFSLFGRAGNTWTFEVDWMATGDEFEGTYDLRAVLVDLAGNMHDAPITGGSLGLDTIVPPPADVDTGRAIWFVRAPWGTADSGGESYFGLVGRPGAVVSDGWVLAYRDREARQEIGRVRANEDGAFGGPDATPTFELATGDLQTVYLRIADDAGNLTSETPGQQDGTAVRDVQWVANAAGKIAGDLVGNPHRLEVAGYLASFEEQRGFVEIGGQRVAQIDGELQGVTGGGTWWHLDGGQAYLPARTYHAMAYDPRSGTSYIAGGLQAVDEGNYVACGGQRNAEFEFVSRGFEQQWKDPYLVGYSEEPREGHAHMVYDGTRGVMMMRSNGQWTYDGTQWRQECLDRACGTDAPPWSTLNHFVYDPVIDRVVAIARDNAVYQWDGETWTRHCDALPCTDSMPVGIATAVAYDENLSETLLFGVGADRRETWSWNGARFRQLCTDEACRALRPAARQQAAMAFDRRSHEMVLFGGDATVDACSFGRVVQAPPELGKPTAAFADTWIFESERWVPRQPATSPPPRYGHAMAYDGVRGRVVLHGGTYCDCYGYDGQPSVYRDVWEWDGSDWTQPGQQTVPSGWYSDTPAGSSHHTMSFDPATERVLMRGGGLGDELWGWIRGHWYSKAGAGLPARGGAMMASRSVAGAESPTGPVVFGGGDLGGFVPTDPYSYRFEADSWVPACGADPCVAGPPSPRYLHSMATDGADLILFGGSDWYPVGAGGPPVGGVYNGAKADTWRMGDAGWRQLCTDIPCGETVPERRAGHAMAHTGVAGQVLLFGGARNVASALSDTWLWDDGQWMAQSVGAQPAARAGHTLVYDSGRETVILYGGTDDPGSEWTGNDYDGYDLDASQYEIPLEHGVVWQWHQGAWSPVHSISPRPGDREPDRRYNHAAAWAPNEQGMLVYGGSEAPELYSFGVNGTADGASDTWLWRPENDGRPALRFRPNLATAGKVLVDHLEAIEFLWRGQASSRQGAADVDVVGILVWDGTGWRQLPSESCAGDCAVYDSTADAAIADATVLSRFIHGSEVRFVISTAGSNGDGAVRAQVDTDYFEARFWYRLPDGGI